MTGLAMRATSLICAMALLAATGSARADGDAARGEKRFEDCVACHKLQAGANEIGPSLHGVFDRKAGELADFRFSPALKRSGITWSAQTLDTFLADPQKVVPANRMPYAGMPDAGDRADLIAYLQKASK
jgi:cytochrome c